MKKTSVRLIVTLFTALILCVMASAVEYQSVTRDAPSDSSSYAGKTVILHSNDVHGAIDGYAYITALRKTFDASGAETILADAGDFSQGTTYVSTTKGADAVTMMNAAGYDIVTLGNHEFDFGYAQLRENLSHADFNIICADVLENGSPIYNPSALYTTRSGLRIGFFGMETPETQTKVNPGLIRGIQFLSKGELYTCAQTQINALKNQGADIVIGLTHLGVDAESAPDGHRSVDLYANTTGIDLLIDGHSHTVMTAGENGEPVQSTGTKFAYIGVVVIDNASRRIEDRYLIPTENLPKDQAVADAAQIIIDRVQAEYGAVFARSETLLNGERDPGNRTEETNLGDLITDAMVWSVLKEEGAVSVDAENVTGVTNGGGIRAGIPAGDVTKNDLNTVLPFGNTIAVVYVTGSQLLEALEASTYCTPEAIGGYPQTCGIEFTLDTTKPYDQGPGYPDSTYYSPDSIQRVTISRINGKAFDLQARYAVVTNNFCAAGGDTYYAFSSAEQYDTGIVMDEAVMAYISEELDGVITAAQYGRPRGDQTILTASTDTTVPVITPPVDPEPIVPPVTPTPEPSTELPPIPVETTPESADTSVTTPPADTSATADTSVTTPPAADTSTTYVVIAGDSLWKIAKKLYGNGNDWERIYTANRSTVRNPDRIYVGQTLIIP